MDADTRHNERPLWSWEELVLAANGTPEGAPAQDLTGFSIDSREVSPGDVFVALKGQRDGHDFVGSAFRAGAAAAIVEDGYRRQPGDGALIRVSDTFAALQAIGSAARARLAPEACVIALTGSAGKTTTKDMLRTGLAMLGTTHAAEKSFNNHLGVPLTLARMPADARYAVFEIGMNHAGEIAPLVQLVRPHVAIVLNVLAAHLGNFHSEEEIADAKAELFLGLEPGGVAIINRGSPYFDRLAERAAASASKVLTFGVAGEAEADACLISCGRRVRAGNDGQMILAEFPSSGTITYQIPLYGQHIAENSVAALLAIEAAGGDVEKAAAGLVQLKPPHGRGEHIHLSCDGGSILLIDESYNANPASMAAAIRTAAQARREGSGRLILALGDMLELGAEAEELHRGLAQVIDAAGADLVFACGPHMAALYYSLPAHVQGHWAATSDGLREPMLEALRPGDVVMVKGSNGSAMAPLATALKQHYAAIEGRV